MSTARTWLLRYFWSYLCPVTEKLLQVPLVALANKYRWIWLSVSRLLTIPMGGPVQIINKVFSSFIIQLSTFTSLWLRFLTIWSRLWSFTRLHSILFLGAGDISIRKYDQKFLNKTLLVFFLQTKRFSSNRALSSRIIAFHEEIYSSDTFSFV